MNMEWVDGDWPENDDGDEDEEIPKPPPEQPRAAETHKSAGGPWGGWRRCMKEIEADGNDRLDT